MNRNRSRYKQNTQTKTCFLGYSERREPSSSASGSNHHWYLYFSAALNSCFVVQLKLSSKFLSHECCLLPMILFLCIFSCIISRSRGYFSHLVMCPKYCNFCVLMIFIISFSFFILLITSALVTLFFHGIRSIFLRVCNPRRETRTNQSN